MYQVFCLQVQVQVGPYKYTNLKYDYEYKYSDLKYKYFKLVLEYKYKYQVGYYKSVMRQRETFSDLILLSTAHIQELIRR